ncbi:MAG: hypothetical protein HZB13_16905 [Acidobacteria bacterium]|nr:hypothetical protein [Acidobacteriota bacterium]
MREEHKELAEIMRFQQSLLRLVTRGAVEQAKSKGATSDHTEQLEAWVRKVRPKAS